jgi:hypothetical protein
MIEVSTRDVPELHVVTEERSVDQAALEAWLPGAMARVHQAGTEAGGVLGTSALPFVQRTGDDQSIFVVLYEGNPNEGPTSVEVCAPIADRAAAARTIPAHREAFVRVTKEQALTGQLGGVYEAVEKWISDQGLEVTAAPRETYWTDFGAAAPGDVVFDISFPCTGRG